MSNGSPARPALADREAVLASLTSMIAGAWRSFDHPRPVEPPIDAALEARLAEPLPEAGHDPDEVLADAARILDESVSPSRPLYLSYIGSTGLEVGVLGAALAATYDVNLAVTAGAADLVERQSLDWVARFIGYPHAEGGFTSGGMTSNLTSLLVARERAIPGCRERGFAGRRGAVYCSAESHYSVVRAAEAAGLGSAQVRRLALDERRRMRPEELEEAVVADVRDGVVPVAVVANGGTTLTGAVDPLAEVADVCERHGVWMHVDGAYGLPAAALPALRPLFAGVERADSVTLDAHKWLGVQKSCSVVLMRSPGGLAGTFGHQESYIRHRPGFQNAVEGTLEYSRPFRSLKLWLVFRVHGAAMLRNWIGETVERAREFAALIRADPEFELACEPVLSTVCFRHAPAGVTDLDAHNLELAHAVQDDGRVYLAPAIVDGCHCQRACFVNFRTSAGDVPRVLAVLRELGARVGASRR